MVPSSQGLLGFTVHCGHTKSKCGFPSPTFSVSVEPCGKVVLRLLLKFHSEVRIVSTAALHGLQLMATHPSLFFPD